jgi:hypothetical protein
MVYGVHHHTAHPGTHTHPSGPAGFADTDILVIQISYLANRRHALGAYHAYFTGIEPECGVLAFTGQQLYRSARAPRDLTTCTLF